jgi:hypothetical protein
VQGLKGHYLKGESGAGQGEGSEEKTGVADVLEI